MEVFAAAALFAALDTTAETEHILPSAMLDFTSIHIDAVLYARFINIKKNVYLINLVLLRK